MATISVKIMAYPSRIDMARSLVHSLNLTANDVIWDKKNNVWDTGSRTWNAIDRRADWGLVLQDDAIVCKDFLAGMRKVLAHIDDAIVCPYLGIRGSVFESVRQAIKKADRLGLHWISATELLWGVAVAVPTHTIDPMLTWTQTQTESGYDVRLGKFYRDKLEWPTYYTWPSLVDHADLPSLLRHGEGRHARKFLGVEKSPLGINWDTESVVMPDVERSYQRVGVLRSAPTSQRVWG